MARTIYSSVISSTNLDTSIYSTITSEGKDPVTPSFGTTSKKAAGIVKLMNMFLKLLYTEKGSNYLDLEEGTDFVQVYSTVPTSENVVLAKVQSAMEDAAEQIMFNQSLRGIPVTEKLRRAYLDSFSVTYDAEGRSVLNIAIGLEVVSGDSTAVQLPSTSPY